jgi:hypothetical protein
VKRIALLTASTIMTSRSSASVLEAAPSLPSSLLTSSRMAAMMPIPFAPTADWPLAPAVEHAIASALREAIGVGLSIAELTEQLNDVLTHFGIELSPDEKRSIIGAHVLSAG